MAMEKHPNDSWNRPNEYVKHGGHLTKYGKEEIKRLHFEGLGPSSIAVRLSISHYKVKNYLKGQDLHGPEETIVRGLSSQWVGT